MVHKSDKARHARGCCCQVLLCTRLNVLMPTASFLLVSAHGVQEERSLDALKRRAWCFAAECLAGPRKLKNVLIGLASNCDAWLVWGWGLVSSRRHTAQKRTFRVHVDVVQRQRASAFAKTAEIGVRPARFPPHVMPSMDGIGDDLLQLSLRTTSPTHPPLTCGNTRRTSQISSPLQSRIFYLKGPPEDLDRWEVGEHLPQPHKTTRARTSTLTA
jgi:hypothetical protein